MFLTLVENLAALERALHMVESEPRLSASYMHSLRHEVEHVRSQLRQY